MQRYAKILIIYLILHIFVVTYPLKLPRPTEDPRSKRGLKFRGHSPEIVKKNCEKFEFFDHFKGYPT